MQVSQFLMWMFWLLGKSPDKQEKLHNEIKTNIGDSPVTVDTLGHLPYLKACVKETFRFFFFFIFFNLFHGLILWQYNCDHTCIWLCISFYIYPVLSRRIPPIATGIARKILEDTEIEGYQIPKGVRFCMHILKISADYI